MLKKKKFWVVIIVLILVLGVGYWRYAIGKSGQDIEKVKVEMGTVREELVLTGEIKADENVTLYFPTSGKISWVGVKEGDSVTKGQAVAKLDTLSLNSDYQRSLADLRSAEATVQKIHDDVRNHSQDETFAQKETRTDAEVAKDKAYESVKKAQQNLRDATLFAPFEGVVSFVANPYSGVNIFATQEQIKIVNPSTIYFEVSADQNEVTQLRSSQKVEILLDSLGEETLDGEVSFVSFTPIEGDVGAIYKVKVKIVSSDLSDLRIGMTGDARFLLKQKENVLYVPLDFVKTDKKGKYVNLNAPNKKVYIETGIEGENRIEIISGVSEGDTLYD